MAAESYPVAVLFATVLSASVPVSAPAQTAVSIEQLRFFTTPEERRRLNALRERPGQHEKQQKAAVQKQAPQPLPSVQVQGIVVRNGGPNTAWVNDGNTLAGELVEGGLRVQAHANGDVRILFSNQGSVALRPGQLYDPASGETIGIGVRKNQ